MAWDSLGWEPVAFSEIESFPSKVLKHHYPNIPNWGDMTKFKEWPDATIDVLVGGTPCQSFSVAGLRKGLDDPRGNLMLTYLAIAAKYRPKWLVWENVPGVLSSNGGLDFASLLRGMGECGYGVAYRVLDAQYFGVAQRRRRVFVVGCLGDWRSAAAVLFEQHSLQGHPAPRREKGKEVAVCLTARAGNGGGFDLESETPVVSRGAACDVADSLTVGANQTTGFVGDVVAQWPAEVAPTLNAHFGEKQGLEDQHINGGGEVSGTLVKNQTMAVAIRTANTNANGHGIAEEVTHTIDQAQGQAVAFAQNTRDEVREMPYVGALAAEPGMKQTSYIRQSMQVRRLTPVECERLQGFPDGYTDIHPNGKPTPDGPRYKALGNSMAVPCMKWIGERIAMVEKIKC